MNNSLGTIGLCKKAGKIIFGFDAVVSEMANEKSELAGIIIVSDISSKTKKEILFNSQKYSVNVKEISATMDEINGVLGKRTGILGIMDTGFYNSIK